MFNNKELAKRFWTEDYKLVNVHDIPDEEFKTRIWSGILEFFLKHIHERQLLKRWQEIAHLLPEIAKVTIGYDYIQTILYYTLTSIDKSDKIELEKMLITTLNKEKGVELMTSLAQSWKEEGIEIGILDGIRIGKAELIKMILNTGNSVDAIAKITGLSIAEIEKLKS